MRIKSLIFVGKIFIVFLIVVLATLIYFSYKRGYLQGNWGNTIYAIYTVQQSNSHIEYDDFINKIEDENTLMALVFAFRDIAYLLNRSDSDKWYSAFFFCIEKLKAKNDSKIIEKLVELKKEFNLNDTDSGEYDAILNGTTFP